MARAPHAISKEPTPYAVICYGDAWGPEHACGRSYLTKEAYDWAMAHPSQVWKCPVCGGNADFDDANWDDHRDGGPAAREWAAENGWLPE